jgi:mRNA-degrading endonuclease toxin of MazEF toxin-antitoxin module
MAIRGQVYAPPQHIKLPRGSPQWHRVVVLSPSNLLAAGACAVVAVIMSKRRPVMGHTVEVPAGTVPFLPLDSVVETHHLFGLQQTELGTLEGKLPDDLMTYVLGCAQRLFK